MTARFFDLEAIGLRLLEDSRHRAVMLRGRGIVPCLALIEVGEDPQSAAYVTRKIEDCKKVGIDVRKVVLPQSVTQSALLAQVQMLDADNAVSGILVQLLCHLIWMKTRSFRPSALIRTLTDFIPSICCP